MTTSQSNGWPYAGARWWKFDFHTHTPASNDYGKGSDQKALRQITPREWLLGFMRAGIDCVAVTDHNSGDWIAQLQEALLTLETEKHAEFRPLHLFPGVEVTANGGVHVLALLDPARTAADVAQLLGAVKFHGQRGAGDESADASPIQVVEGIARAGGLAILAHVDGPSGAFTVLNGSTLSPLLSSPDLYAIEVCNATSPKPDLYQQRKLAWAEVLGSDAHHAMGSTGQQYPGSRFTWTKMAAPPSLDGLRLSLLDGVGFSIRRSDEKEPGFDPHLFPEHFIESIEVANARYMGRGEPQTLALSPWFNALIGGRGTGKSTVLHLLRLAYRREAEVAALDDDSEVRRTFDRFSRVPRSREESGGLLAESSVIVTLMRDGVRHRLRWMQDGSGTAVEDEAPGGRRDSDSQIVTPERFPLRLFSQGQIAALANDGHKALLGVIDEAAGTKAQKAAVDDAARRFLALRASIRDFVGKLASRPALKVQLDDVRRKLDRFEQAHHAEVLKAYQLHARQEREIDRQMDTADEIANRVKQLADELRAEDLPSELFSESSNEEKEAGALVTRLAQAIRQSADTLRQAARELNELVERERAALPTSRWRARNAEWKSRYAALVKTLKDQGVSDPSEYGKLVQERQRLEAEVGRLDSIEKQRLKLAEQEAEQLTRVWQARRAVSERRREFLGNALAGNPYVRIELEMYGRDARTIERSLREILGVNDDRFSDDILVIENDLPARGAVAELLKALPADANAGLTEIESRIGQFKESIKELCEGLGRVNFGGHFTNYLERESKRRPELVDRVLTWFPDDSLRVTYSRKGDGQDFQPIGQASAGQRAAAMLAFLLAHGDEPIVLDQPEDDLDNHLIYELVVRQLRANKQRRQIVVVTHNPNIVVNGDAEMVHALDFRAGQCRVVQAGSLQQRPMREEVCRVMEGGREAFELRYRRLGREVGDVR